jgi:hypothetical protein
MSAKADRGANAKKARAKLHSRNFMFDDPLRVSVWSLLFNVELSRLGLELPRRGTAQSQIWYEVGDGRERRTFGLMFRQPRTKYGTPPTLSRCTAFDGRAARSLNVAAQLALRAVLKNSPRALRPG